MREMNSCFRSLLALSLLTLSLVAGFSSAVQAEPLLRSGDSVLWLGGTWIEREQVEGYWEVQLTAALRQPIRFRNLGWSGDTVWAESRGMFDPPAQGYERMLNQIREINPNVIILGYGPAEAFNGPGGVESFIQQYDRLLTDLQGENRRLMLLAPLPMRAAEVPGKNRAAVEQQVATYNASLERYTAAIRDLAQRRGLPLIDLRPACAHWSGARPLTDNGITLNGLGYWVTGRELTRVLVDQQPAPELDSPEPALLSVSPLAISAGDPYEHLRSLIRRKNELLFHRWRPQNFTYLFGFRKHEQGTNAVEIPQFDPLVAELEQQIAAIVAP
jgi:hypothetical protein